MTPSHQADPKLALESRPTRFARLALTTVQVMRALYEAGRPITSIALAVNVAPETVRRHARNQQWQRLTDERPNSGTTEGREQRIADPQATMASIEHKASVRRLCGALSTLCGEPTLGSTAHGSRSKAALELARALTVAVALERKLLGLDDAGGDARGPGVVIVVPQVAAPSDWDKAARAHRRLTAPRRQAMVTVHEGPPPADDGDDSPDLDAED